MNVQALACVHISILDIINILSALSFLSQQALDENMDLLEGITGFEDSVRKCKSVCEPGLPSGRGVENGSWVLGSGSSPPLSLISTVICHVVGITYQHIDRWLLAEMLGDLTGKALWVPSASLGGWGWLGQWVNPHCSPGPSRGRKQESV